MNKKYFFYVLVFSIFSIKVFAQNNSRLVFEKKEYDFGKIFLGSGAVQYRFVFKNEGNDPLLINDVRSSCGCVSAGWTKNPVAPGDTGSVSVIYENNVSGTFRKSLRVISNSQQENKMTLIIKGNTIRKK